MKKEDMSLVTMLRENPDYINRIQEVAEEVKKDKTKILNMADKYNTKYKSEIDADTIKRQIMITEGVKSGKTEREAESTIGFVPSVYTPIMNWLYFFMRENDDPKRDTLQNGEEERYKTLIFEQQDVKGMDKVPENFVMMWSK